MMHIRRIIGCLLLLLLPACNVQQARTAKNHDGSKRLAIRAARLLDVNSGRLINNAVVLIDGEKITAVGSNIAVPSQTELIDLGNVTVLPGLIDAHTHITYHFDATGHFGLAGDSSPAVTARYAAENARNTLYAGFTTARNLGAGERVDLNLRDAINRGEIPGPRLLVSGEPLLSDMIPESADSSTRLQLIRRFVRARVDEGADVIKIFEGIDESGKPLFSEDEIRAAVEEATKTNRRVAVHAHEAAAIKAAVKGGCASIEHGTFLDDEAIRLLVEHHTALVPTLYLPTYYLEHKSQFVFDNSAWEFFERLQAHNLDNARRAKKAGVWIVSGSDAVAGLHGHNARELEWLVKAGLTPAEAIRAATVDAARLLGLEAETGEIKAGKAADIIAVAGDPLRNINTLEEVKFVMKGGNIVKDDLTRGRTR